MHYDSDVDDIESIQNCLKIDNQNFIYRKIDGTKKVENGSAVRTQTVFRGST